jgi:hypothetical protein
VPVNRPTPDGMRDFGPDGAQPHGSTLVAIENRSEHPPSRCLQVDCAQPQEEVPARFRSLADRPRERGR